MKQNIFSTVVIMVIVIFLALPSLSPAQIPSGQITKTSEDKNYELKYTVMFSTDDLVFNTVMGYDVVQLKDGSYRNTIGKPMLPVKEIKIALPKDMKVTQLQVVDVQRVALDGTYLIFPAQPPRKLDDSDKQIPFTEPDTTATEVV
jgi:hypothetical protein